MVLTGTLSVTYIFLKVSTSTHIFELEGIFMAEKEARNFALRDAKGNEEGVFTGKSPRQAALKAANRGVTDIRLRERGTKKVHIFSGERKQIKKPKNAPAWMPAKIWKPFVKKVGTEKLEDL
jgi:hypothetical protein